MVFNYSQLPGFISDSYYIQHAISKHTGNAKMHAVPRKSH